MSSNNSKLIRMVLAAFFLATALLLPFLTGQIPEIGGMLCPMHLPVLLCGFFCGPWYGFVIGLIAPIFRFFLFNMPPIFPTGVSMSIELAFYGLTAGIMYKILPPKKICVYISLFVAMIVGRIMWGLSRLVLMGLGKIDFGFEIFITESISKAVPGIILQIILAPLLVISLKKIHKSPPV